jgi:hypothetical protein
MKQFLIITLLFISQVSIAQASFDEFNLTYGTYDVGFKNIEMKDPMRGYDYSMEQNDQKGARPISASLWYPATMKEGDETVKILDYLRIFTAEKEWKYLPDEELLNWYQYWNTHKNRASIQGTSKAFKKAEIAKGKFPLIIYAPSYEASSIENFAWAEFLASHGYMVVSCPSLGPNDQWIRKDLMGGLQSQARDLEFLLHKFSQLPQVDSGKIATAGFSFGGLSNVLFQMRNQQIKAILSLDGTVRYNYKLLKEASGFDMNNVDVPFLHMAQKAIPEEVMKKDQMDSKLNTDFDFYDDLKFSDAYKLRFHDLTHLNFSAMDVMLKNHDPKQDKSDEKILNSYRLVLAYSLQFLNAYLKDDPVAFKYLQQTENSELISKEFKKAKEKGFTFRDFHALAKKRQYQNLISLYNSIKKKHPTFQIPEGAINQVGLQLIFNPKTAKHGIAIYELALHIYPKSANLYDSLATGYFYLGNKEQATKNFKKSLDLYPQNQHAKDKLKKLGNN